MKITKDEKGEIEVIFDKQDVGVTNMIVDKLLENKSVKFASSSYDHPLKGNAVLRIVASDPWDELKKAVKQAKGELHELEKALKKAR